MIDSYLHCGGPRFGPSMNALRELDRHKISRGILVLPPACPDFKELEAARELKGNDVRLVGIPFGESASQRAELTEWQISFGITGMRLMPQEISNNPDSLKLLGQTGRWLFAINPYESSETLVNLLDWLESFPEGRIVCPHFFKPGRIDSFLEDPTLFRAFLGHPRVFIIFSRQGNTGTTLPYPHADLRPWIEDVVAITGWSKILWGSEYPVLYWRDEQFPQAWQWLRELMPEMCESTYSGFLHGNAEHLFFSTPPPAPTGAKPPAWLHDVSLQGFPVPIAQKGIKLSPDAGAKLSQAYLDANTPDAPLAYSEFIAKWIEEKIG